MSDHSSSHPDQQPASTPQDVGSEPRGFWRSPAGFVTIAFLVIGGFFLVAEHRAHLVPYVGYYLPILLLLACLPMHLFTHGGHHHQRRGASTEDDEDVPGHRH
ncbi:MAG: DUF2933 domain-containing protein [Devosia sp.]|uniref:DUF2933 domain-containing protein n=1 Tax=Devosia sp. TaxID=1871048 RepID=UPI001AD189A0|nr:DUF2933 domain-containing protein [Devosia sp.]MBN9308789.1 DUF2933 domain-containing protein [Devosia sp.]MBN9317273.1 DUF2933 domain-containing protein [Devosia sp.]